MIRKRMSPRPSGGTKVTTWSALRQIMAGNNASPAAGPDAFFSLLLSSLAFCPWGVASTRASRVHPRSSGATWRQGDKKMNSEMLNFAISKGTLPFCAWGDDELLMMSENTITHACL